MKLEFDTPVIITEEQFEDMVENVIKSREFVYSADKKEGLLFLNSIGGSLITLDNMPEIGNYLWLAVESRDYLSKQ